jgi:hypothetical protein
MHILRHKIILFKQKTKAFKQTLLSGTFIQLTKKTKFQSFPDLTSFFCLTASMINLILALNAICD